MVYVCNKYEWGWLGSFRFMYCKCSLTWCLSKGEYYFYWFLPGCLHLLLASLPINMHSWRKLLGIVVCYLPCNTKICAWVKYLVNNCAYTTGCLTPWWRGWRQTSAHKAPSRPKHPRSEALGCCTQLRQLPGSRPSQGPDFLLFRWRVLENCSSPGISQAGKVREVAVRDWELKWSSGAAAGFPCDPSDLLLVEMCLLSRLKCKLTFLSSHKFSPGMLGSLVSEFSPNLWAKEFLWLKQGITKSSNQTAISAITCCWE